MRGTSAASDEWRRIWPVSCSVEVSNVCLWKRTHTHRFPATCVCVCVCVSVAVYRMHVELQTRMHTCVCVYICTYKHPEGISTLSPTYCIYLQQECKRKYFQYIYLEQILIIIRVKPLMDKLTAMWYELVCFINVKLWTNIYSLLLFFCSFKSVSYKFLF